MKVSMAMASSISSSAIAVVVFLSAALLFAAAHADEHHHVEAAAAAVAGIHHDPLVPICRTIAGGSNFIEAGFCVTALRSDPRSRGARTYRDFAAIAVDLVTANATATTARIAALLRRTGKAAAGDVGESAAAGMRRCLESCLALYDGVVGRQPGCAAAVRAGRFSEAAASLVVSASGARECEDWFVKNGVESPVENDRAVKLAMLGAGLLRYAK